MIPSGAEVVTDPATLVEFFADRPGAHVYALCDLEEPYWTASRWYRRGNAVVGVVQMPDGQGAAVYGVSTQDPSGTLTLLTELHSILPPGQLITGPTGLANAFHGQRPLRWARPHLRYELSTSTAVPDRDPRIVDLDRRHLDDLNALYANEPGAAFFLPHMLDDETFVGAYDAGQLVAAAGTHVLSETKSCGAVGGVYAHPEHRGRGLGRAVTAGVIERIGTRANLIALNVATDNRPARSVYEQMGFEPILDYEECELG